MGADEPESPEQLYNRLRPSLVRHAVMILADVHAAEDVVQQVFLRFLQGDQVPRTPDGYLRRATRNACYDLARAYRRRAEHNAPSFLESVEAREDRPDERLAIEETLRALWADQREVVHLKVYEGLTFEQIAAQIDESPNAVASRYRYAMAKLKHALDPDHDR